MSASEIQPNMFRLESDSEYDGGEDKQFIYLFVKLTWK